MELLSQVFNGLGMGSVYALVALGYSMVYGIVKLINFAHGDIIMVGSYTVLTCLVMWGWPLWMALLAAVIFCAVVGVLIEKVAYQRLLDSGAPRIALLITAISVSIFLQNLYQLLYGAASQSLPALISLPLLTVNGVPVSKTLLNISVACVMMLGLHILTSRTKIGRAMRATSEDAGAATLMGVNTRQIIMFTFAVGSALAAVGAILNVNTYNSIKPTMGGLLGLKAFVAAVLGGIGSMPGAMLGGFVLGLAESMAKAVGLGHYQDAVVFALLIIILLIKPNGLLGKNVKEKV